MKFQEKNYKIPLYNIGKMKDKIDEEARRIIDCANRRFKEIIDDLRFRGVSWNSSSPYTKFTKYTN